MKKEFYNETCTSSVLLRDARSSVLEESLSKLGIEKLSKEDVQKMQWEVLEAKIGNWVHFVRIAVGILIIASILLFYTLRYIRTYLSVFII